jgi:acetyl-CoA synthetase
MPAARETAARDDHEALHRGFRWQVPRRFDIARACVARWARDRGRVAIVVDGGDGTARSVTYRELHLAANRLANALAALGVRRGDRVAIVLPQRPETAIAHFAIYRLGAVAMPMSVLFGPDALAYRFEDSGAVAAIVDAQYLENTRAARGEGLRHVIVAAADGERPPLGPGELDLDALLARSADRFAAVPVLAGDPADLIYTSGTTGPPKGALIPHRALIGNLPGFVASQNWFPQPGDVFWSPADWAWTGGLMDALLPTLYFGLPIVAQRGRFSAESAYTLIERHGVTNAFLFPTALKMMMKADPQPRARRSLRLRAIMSAGESVGETLFDWCEHGLGVTVNEMFGQTEVNYVVGNSALRWPARPGSIGRPYPGHRVAVIDDAGREVPAGELGEVAVNRFDRHGHPDPVFFLGYWRNDDATARKYTGDWCRTGDLATRDADGYLWYGGRADDMFKAAGYRIGPSEVENCLVKHPAVANAAVVPKPDRERGNLVKAYVVATPEFAQRLAADPAESARLAAELQEHVRGKLAPYEYPKEVEFVAELPMTTTGKVQRRVLRLQEEERARRAPPR